MKRIPFDSEERISAINKFRIAMNGEKFSKAQILAVFKENHLPCNSSFWSTFKRSGIIKKIGRDQYVFSSDKPIFHGVLNTIYQKYRAMANGYQQKHRQKPKEEEEQVPNPDEEARATEAFAIDFLKERGYKILAPVCTIYRPV